MKNYIDYIDKDIHYIRSYYSNIPDKFVSLTEKIPEDTLLYNLNNGIGDSLMLFLFDEFTQNTKNITVQYNSNIAENLKSFNPYIYSIRNDKSDKSLFICEIQDKIRFPGHFLQNIQYCLDIPIQDIPKPKLTNNIKTIKNRVVLTFDRGAHGAFQTNIHPRPRILYEEHKYTIEQFIKNNNKYEFIEVGKTSSNIKGAINQTDLGIEETTKIIGSCEYFFGIHNGLMHIATAFNKKCIIIVNFPHAHEIVLPMLKRTDFPDLDWLYPQNIHLHQDEDSCLVPKLSYSSIEAAFSGAVYPYFAYDIINKNI